MYKYGIRLITTIDRALRDLIENKILIKISGGVAW